MSFRRCAFLACCALASSLAGCDDQDTVISVNIRTSYDLSKKLNKVAGSEDTATPLKDKDIIVHISQEGQTTVNHTFRFTPKPTVETVKAMDGTETMRMVTKLQDTESVHDRVVLPSGWHDGKVTVTVDPIELAWDADDWVKAPGNKLLLKAATSDQKADPMSRDGRAVAEGSFELEAGTARVSYVDLQLPDKLPADPMPTAMPSATTAPSASMTPSATAAAPTAAPSATTTPSATAAATGTGAASSASAMPSSSARPSGTAAM